MMLSRIIWSRMPRISENQERRVLSSARNMASSAFFQTLLGIAAFIERTVFIRCLGDDFLGMNTLFANILSVLAIAELGIGGTIAYALYKPLAEHDEEKIASLMLFYRKAYTAIGSAIIGVGLLITPFLHLFTKSDIQIDNMRLYFIIYLLAIGLTYYVSYKHIILEADQKKYLNYTVTCLGSIVQYALQIAILVMTRNYGLYVTVFLVVNVGKCLVLNRISSRSYPVLRRRSRDVRKLDSEDRKEITTNIKAMCFHKFGETAVNSSDSIMMSYFTSLATLGIYSNYLMIVNTLRSAMRVFYVSILASIGNLCATEDDESIYYSFRTLNFANYLIFSYVTVLMFNLIQPVITLWLGAGYTFDTLTVFLICMIFFLPGIRRMLLNYHDACGLFWADKYKRIWEALANIVISVALAFPLGIDGIIIGTIASNLLGFWIEGRVVYRNVFHRPVSGYVLQYIRETLVTMALMILVHAICTQIPASGAVVQLVVNALVAVLVPLPAYYLLYHHKAEFRSVINNMRDYARLIFRSKRRPDA